MSQLFNTYICISFLILSCNLTEKSSVASSGKNSPVLKKEEVYITKEGVELLQDEILNLLTPKVKKELGIKYEIFKVFAFEDKLGKQFVVFTESVPKEQINDNNKIVDNIEAFNLLQVNKSEFKILWTMRDFINEYEKSIWFWTKYLNLIDIDSDGYVEPIIVYGSQSKYGSGKFYEGRVKILTYYRGKKIAIRHQNSELDNGRFTQIDDGFYNMPKVIKIEIYDKVILLQDNGHALFNTNFLKKVESSFK